MRIGEEGELVCPFCRSNLLDAPVESRRLIRSIVMTDLLPALFHDLGHDCSQALNTFEHLRYLVAKGKISDRDSNKFIIENTDRGIHAIRRIGKLFRTLVEIFLGRGSRKFHPLSDLPKEIEQILDLTNATPLIDFSPLERPLAKHIDEEAYLITFFAVLIKALILLGRDRRPTMEVSFEVIDTALRTRLKLSHHGELNYRGSPYWEYIRWCVRLAGGRISIDLKTPYLTWIAWDLPIVGEESNE